MSQNRVSMLKVMCW